MKYYCFIETDYDCERIFTFPHPFDFYNVPSPFFTLEDIKTNTDFNSIPKTTMSRILKGKVGTKIKLHKQCGWSSRCGGPTYHAIYIVDEQHELYTITQQQEQLKQEASKLRGQLQEVELYQQLKKKEQELTKVNKRFKEIMK